MVDAFWVRLIMSFVGSANMLGSSWGGEYRARSLGVAMSAYGRA